MATMHNLVRRVDDEFARSSSTSPWENPHPDRDPEDGEYSRCLDPGKWRILGERVDAWFSVVESAGLGVIERDALASWVERPLHEFSRIDRLLPRRSGAMPLLVGRSRIGDVDDAGVVVGVGDPAICVGWFPDCGCDACDDGSTNAIEHLDTHLHGIIAGTFRHLARGDRSITTLDGESWASRNLRVSRWRGSERVDQILADPTGWTEIGGEAWIG